MTSKILVFASAFLFAATMFANISSSFGANTSNAAGLANMEDPKMIQDNARIAQPAVMAAQSLVRGAGPCETGACYGPADPTLGTEPVVVINPPNVPTVPVVPTKTGKTVD